VPTQGRITRSRVEPQSDDVHPASIWKRIPDGELPPASMEALARIYVEQVREEQPHGPYLLAGWSLGGMPNRPSSAVSTSRHCCMVRHPFRCVTQTPENSPVRQDGCPRSPASAAAWAEPGSVGTLLARAPTRGPGRRSWSMVATRSVAAASVRAERHLGAVVGERQGCCRMRSGTRRPRAVFRSADGQTQAHPFCWWRHGRPWLEEWLASTGSRVDARQPCFSSQRWPPLPGRCRPRQRQPGNGCWARREAPHESKPWRGHAPGGRARSRSGGATRTARRHCLPPGTRSPVTWRKPGLRSGTGPEATRRARGP
jgi:hypothetical protein